MKRELIQDAGAAYGAAQEATKRGITIEYREAGDSYTSPITPGTHVLAVCDPPYYKTSDYNGNDRVGVGTYRRTADLLQRLSAAGNSIVYTDSAWWRKDLDEEAKAETNGQGMLWSAEYLARDQDGDRELAKILALNPNPIIVPVGGRDEILSVIKPNDTARRTVPGPGTGGRGTDPGAVRPDSSQAVPGMAGGVAGAAAALRSGQDHDVGQAPNPDAGTTDLKALVGAPPATPLTLTLASPVVKRIAGRLAAAINDRIHLVETGDALPADLQAMIRKRGHQPNEMQGFWLPDATDPRNGHIWLIAATHPNADELQRTLLHEMGHWGLIKLLGKKRAQQLLNQIWRNGAADPRMLRIAKAQGFDLNTVEGWINTTEELLVDTDALSGRNPGLRERLTAAVRQALRALGFRVDFTAADMSAIIHPARKSLDKTITPAEIATSANDDISQPIPQETFPSDLQAYINGKLATSRILELGQSSEILKSFGVPDLTITLRQSILRKANRHGIQLADLAPLPQEMQTPLAIFKSTKPDNKIIIITRLVHEDGNIMVALQQAPENGVLQVNDISSIHPKQDENIINWIKQGLLLGYDNRNGRDWLEHLVPPNSGQIQAEAAISTAKVYRSDQNTNQPDDNAWMSRRPPMPAIGEQARLELLSGIKTEAAARTSSGQTPKNVADHPGDAKFRKAGQEQPAPAGSAAEYVLAKANRPLWRRMFGGLIPDLSIDDFKWGEKVNGLPIEN
ncbi:MAG: hypothetical protein WCH61_03475 [bacterium]